MSIQSDILWKVNFTDFIKDILQRNPENATSNKNATWWDDRQYIHEVNLITYFSCMLLF